MMLCWLFFDAQDFPSRFLHKENTKNEQEQQSKEALVQLLLYFPLMLSILSSDYCEGLDIEEAGDGMERKLERDGERRKEREAGNHRSSTIRHAFDTRYALTTTWMKKPTTKEQSRVGWRRTEHSEQEVIQHNHPGSLTSARNVLIQQLLSSQAKKKRCKERRERRGWQA